MILAMIPARMGSQRLKQKNLRELNGVPLITRAIRKCQAAGVFDAIWVNSEHPAFGEIAAAEGVGFHQRPEALGNNQATSEQYIAEFLEQHPCDFVVQVHSIAPLLMVEDPRMRKPKPRIQLPPRDSDNDGRQLDPSPNARMLARLVKSARYGCYAKHKAAPHAYGLRPYSGPKGDHTRCDEHASFDKTKMTSIPRLLQRGIRAGLVGPSARLIWTVGDDGWIFEGRVTNVGQDEYHGYPVRPTEAIAELVYRRYSEWAAEQGDAADQQAAVRCRVMYGFQP